MSDVTNRYLGVRRARQVEPLALRRTCLL